MTGLHVYTRVVLASIAGLISIGWGEWAADAGTKLPSDKQTFNWIDAVHQGAPVQYAGGALAEKAGRQWAAEMPRAAAPAESDSGMRKRVLRITAYADRGLTASGVYVDVGQCAAPADVPFGSRIFIPALGREYIVTDRTHKRFRHNTVDIFIPDVAACRKFGRRHLECVILPPEKPYRYGCRDLAARAAAFGRMLVRAAN